MRHKEEIIREQRTIEANRKNLMGPRGKLCMIAKYLGDPMTFEGSGLYSSNELEAWDVFVEEEIPTAEDNNLVEIGYNFSGLQYGVHMDIRYLEDRNETTVEYCGNIVYKEASGILDRYAPSETWEEQVEKLYLKARERAAQREKDDIAENRIVRRRLGMDFLDEMKRKWGI